MIQSFIVYGLLLIIMIGLGRVASYRERINGVNTLSFFTWEIFASILLFAVFCGLRYDVGVDYLSYLQSYEYIKEGYNPRNDTEFLFSLITNLFAGINAHFSFYFAFFALLQIFFLYYAFKNQRFILPFLIFVLLTNGWFFNFMGGIRQTLVCTMFIMSIKFIVERKLKSFLFIIITGFFIHKSALFLIPFYFLKLDKDWFKNRWVQISLLIFSAVLSSMYIWENFIDLISTVMSLVGYDETYIHIDAQLKNSTEEFSKGIRFYAPLAVFLIISFFSKNIKSEFKNHYFIQYYNLYFIGAVSFFLFFNNFLLKRPMFYFTSMSIVVTAYLLYYLWKRIEVDILYFFIFIFLFFLHIGILVAYLASDFHTSYKFFWEISK